MLSHRFCLEVGPNCVRFRTNGTNLGLFKISFQYILAPRAKMYWKLILKSPRFVPFGVNLIQFRGNSDILAQTNILSGGVAFRTEIGLNETFHEKAINRHTTTGGLISLFDLVIGHRLTSVRDLGSDQCLLRVPGHFINIDVCVLGPVLLTLENVWLILWLMIIIYIILVTIIQYYDIHFFLTHNL